MIIRKLKSLLIVVFLLSLFSSCIKDNDDQIGGASSLDVQQFIYRGLNIYYLYKSEKEELATKYFGSEGEMNSFLDDFATPEDLFAYLTDVPDDKFSFIISDYRILENALDGVSKNNGMQYGLVKYSETSDNIFGYVRYVLPNSSAADKMVERGMIFTGINGERLTVNNYNALLSQDNYTINLAEITNTGGELTITPTADKITLEKNKYTENPVHIAKVLEIGGHKIGYLMYNAFTSDFDNELNAAFGSFKAKGVTDLVLDLRYNGGGSIESANDLCSMITGQNEGELFITEDFNENFEDLKLNFNTKISSGESINSLMLNKVYVLTGPSTASASELILSGLDPYIEVIQIGATTVGKYQGSTILYDSPTFGIKDRSLKHRYCMLPLILKSVNAAGFTDYGNGIAPKILLKENYTKLGILGDKDEPLLNMAIQKITGNSSPRLFSEMQSEKYELIGESGENAMLYQLMY